MKKSRAKKAANKAEAPQDEQNNHKIPASMEAGDIFIHQMYCA